MRSNLVEIFDTVSIFVASAKRGATESTVCVTIDVAESSSEIVFITVVFESRRKHETGRH